MFTRLKRHGRMDAGKHTQDSLCIFTCACPSVSFAPIVNMNCAVTSARSERELALRRGLLRSFPTRVFPLRCYSPWPHRVLFSPHNLSTTHYVKRRDPDNPVHASACHSLYAPPFLLRTQPTTQLPSSPLSQLRTHLRIVGRVGS